jgi:hypothetical protein
MQEARFDNPRPWYYENPDAQSGYPLGRAGSAGRVQGSKGPEEMKNSFYREK